MSSPEKLTYSQMKAIFLVLTGTFLEYFDLVLYVHLAIVLNPLFFPSSDPWTVALLSAFTFSASYILRPLGAFVFGYVGDQKGRKAAIVWTSALMGIATLLIACLPSYASLGFSASCLFIFARILQGFSSVGEIINAKVFIAEVTEKSPFVNFLNILPVTAIVLSSMVALGLGNLCLSLDPINGWRWPFLLGASVALIGAWIRLRVVESPTFLVAQKKKKSPTSRDAKRLFQAFSLWRKNYWLYFGIESLTPLTFYFAFRFCSDALKKIGVSTTEVMVHNFWVFFLYLFFVLGLGALALRYDPLTILRRRIFAGFCATPILLWMLSAFPSKVTIFSIQLLLLSFFSGSDPAQFKIIQSFPVIGRCTNLGSAYAISHAAMYVVTSVLFVSVGRVWGLWGVSFLFMTTALTAFYCVRKFKTEPDSLGSDTRILQESSPMY